MYCKLLHSIMVIFKGELPLNKPPSAVGALVGFVTTVDLSMPVE